MQIQVFVLTHMDIYIKIQLALFQKEFNSTCQNMYIKIKWYFKAQENKHLKIR